MSYCVRLRMQTVVVNVTDIRRWVFSFRNSTTISAEANGRKQWKCLFGSNVTNWVSPAGTLDTLLMIRKSSWRSRLDMCVVLLHTSNDHGDKRPKKENNDMARTTELGERWADVESSVRHATKMFGVSSNVKSNYLFLSWILHTNFQCW